jgi:glucosamine-6-phosphate isomerase
VGLDEWLGIPPQNEGSCSFYLNHHLFKPLNLTPEQIHVFDALSADPESECARIDAIIRRKGKINLMLVGVGMNGHIGFNEPGVPADLYSHVVNLDPVTQAVGQKYFASTTTLSRGITLGLRHFFESRKAIMIANGSKKAEIVKLALEGPVSINVPASAIQHHSNAIVMLDEEAARSLGK